MRSGAEEVLQPVLSKVCELELDELGCRGRDEHLAAVSDSGDASRTVDVTADVALVCQQWRPGV